MQSFLITLGDGTVRVSGFEKVECLGRFLRSFEPLPKGNASVDCDIEITVYDNQFQCVRDDNESPYYVADTAGDFLLLFERTLLNLYLEYLPPRSLVFHGSGFYDEGTLIGLLGEANAGKTTAAAEMIHEDWSFVSDELLAIDFTSNTLYPFPRPMNFSEDPESQKLEVLRVEDNQHNSFFYGLPERDDVQSDPTSVDECYLYNLVRDGTSPPSVEPLQRGDSFLGLSEYVLKPWNSSKTFNRLSGYLDESVHHHRLRYADSSELLQLSLADNEIQ
ncbi:MAG: hypothetical protein ABEK50_10000 [bacterium]